MSDPSEVTGSPSIVSLLGRILMCWIFLYSAWGQIVEFTYWSGRAAQKSMPLPAVAIALSIIIQVLGGLAVLLGVKARVAGWALFLFLIPTTLIFHDFWTVTGAAHDAQIVNFNRNLAIMGGMLILATFGPGAYSVDAMRGDMPPRR
jgi:putative oxidoreductase